MRPQKHLIVLLAALASLFFAYPTARGQFGLPMGGGDNKPRATIDTNNVVLLAAVFPALRPFQGLPSYDGIRDSSIRYTTLGNAKYDQLFKQAAEMNARVQATKFLVSKYGKNPSSFATNWVSDLKLAEKKEKVEQELKELTSQPEKAFAKLLKLLAEELAKDNARSAELSQQFTGLNPTNDFSLLDVEAVRKALEKGKENLEAAAKGIPSLLEEIGKITK